MSNSVPEAKPEAVLDAAPISFAYRCWLFLRSLVFWVWQIVWTLTMGVPVVVLGMFSYNLGYRMGVIWNQGNVYGLRVICGVRWKLEGEENIPAKAGIMMSKHQSTWETYFFMLVFPRAAYVAKRSLALIPIFGWALIVLRFILIDRKSGGSAIAQMVEQARERNEHGIWVLIFPEGTRRPVGSEPAYRIGGAVVAERTGADITPVALNAGEFWPRMGFIKWPGEITVSIGPPIVNGGRKAEVLLAEAEAWIEGRMAEITVKNRFPYKAGGPSTGNAG
ncbi:MAG: lysophospholipid acyltransferase family protein [Granulosicoccus sp.]